MNRKTVLITVVVGCVGIGCLLLGLLGAPVLADIFSIKGHEWAMQKPEVYEPVGRTLALYCQSDPHLLPRLLDEAWFPAELRQIGHGWGTVSLQQARIEMGGGFYHYGYWLNLDTQASTPETNVWQLFLYREEADNKHLLTLTLPKTESLSVSALFGIVLAGYNEQIAADPANVDLQQRQIQFLLDFNQVDAAHQAVKELVQAMPDNGWANLVNALVVAETESPQQAEQLLTGWVEQKPDFFRYLDLAYYYQWQQQPHRAAQAMLRATQYAADPTQEHSGNAAYRGYNAAMYAFRAKEYEAAIKLSDKLLGVTDNGSYAREALLKLKEAALSSAAGEEVKLEWAQEIAVFDPFERVNINKLLQHRTAHP